MYLSDEKMILGSSSCSGLRKSLDISENKVNFVNVKMRYEIGEDLTLDYTLHEEFKSSTRDWIGIFPRNWSNLQQYLTFEYTLPAPPNAVNPSSRTISFPRIFHREAPLNLEYQFVYVSKEIQIAAKSCHFRFVPSLNDNAVNGYPCATSVCTNSAVAPNASVNKIAEATQQQQQPGVLRPTCRYCHRKICGLRIDALRGDFLATFSDSLLNRVHRLEGDLSFAESALRNSKGARENLARRLQAYEAFVAEMLKSLAVRGTVKITDEKGTEIVLQRLNENDRTSESDENNSLEDEIVALKGLLEKQREIIADLELKKTFNVDPQKSYRASCRVDRGIQTNFESDENFEPAKHRGKRDVEKKCDEWREKNSRTIVVNTKRGKLSLDKNVKGKEIGSVYAEKSLGKDVDGIGGNALKDGTEQVVLKIPKPSGILVQGKDVKFAIVRL